MDTGTYEQIRARIEQLQQMRVQLAEQVLRANPDVAALDGAIIELSALLPPEVEKEGGSEGDGNSSVLP